MGMFDELICKYPLPYPELQGVVFQTKDTPSQYMDLYEIREDGTLWHEQHDVRWEFSEELPLGMRMHRENKRWVQVDFEGELEIHHLITSEVSQDYWYSIRFWFKAGKVADVIHHKRPSGLAIDEAIAANQGE